MAHLGLGNFFRAHQAWYTANSTDADAWGIAAFSGRRTDLAAALTAQGGLYTVVSRAPNDDTFEVITSLSQAFPGNDHESWLAAMAAQDVSVLTTTITEAGYLRAAGGGLDTTHPAVSRDIAALRADVRAVVKTAPARILAGLLARRDADAGPLTLVPCDNLPDNGPVLHRVLRDLLQCVVPTASDWFDESVWSVTTVVDRITPASTPEDRAVVLAGTGFEDSCAVVTEPFSEWVMSGEFRGNRPAWETAGVVFTEDIAPYEQRKLWLLNGGHSLLAYVGLARGHSTIAEAVRDEHCGSLLRAWWALCASHLAIGHGEARSYCAELLERFANPRISHNLAQIAADGAQKLPIRLIPVLRLERQANRLPEIVTVVLGAWIVALRGESPPSDARSAELHEAVSQPLLDAVPAALRLLDPALADDAELVAAIVAADLRPAGR